MMTEDTDHIRDHGAGPDTGPAAPAGGPTPPPATTFDPDEVLGPMPAAMFDDAEDMLGPVPAAMYDEPAGPPPAGPGVPAAARSAGPDARAAGTSRNIATLSHLSAFAVFAGLPSFIGPLIVWLMERNRDPFVEAHAREALNFNLSLLVYALAAVALAVVTLGVGLLVIVPVALLTIPAWLVATIMAAVKAADGQPFRYPLTLRLLS